MKTRLFIFFIAVGLVSCAGDKKQSVDHSAEAVKKTEQKVENKEPEKAQINYDIANIKKNSNTDLMQRARDVNMIKMEINNLKRDISKTLSKLEE